MVELNPALTRGARAVLAWSVAALADRAKVSVSSIKRFEPQGWVRRTTLRVIQTAFEENGLRFCVNDDGVVGIFAAIIPRRSLR